MSSDRPEGDMLWNWVRPSKKTKPHLTFEDRGHGLLELICGAAWPGKVMSNRDDGSYATRDLFVKHPTMEAYKYFSRLDDTINLINGEKANPLVLEGAVRQQPGIREAVAVGHGKPRIGLMLIPTHEVAASERDAFLDRIWPVVERSQADMPAYAQLSKDMVTILPPDTNYPMTDKRTIIRQAFYRQFEDQIEAAYAEKESEEGSLDLELPELQEFIHSEVQKVTGLAKDSFNVDSDFFSLGMDSLQATQVRSSLLSQLKLYGNKLGLNVVFDYPSVESLAGKIHSFKSGKVEDEVTVQSQMERLIAKYSVFSGTGSRDTQGQWVPEGQCILLTGSSGSLGSHILAKLLVMGQVKKVICHVRAQTEALGRERIMQSLRSRMIHGDIDEGSLGKVQVLIEDLSEPGLGLSGEAFDAMAREVTTVIHCAWSVNFNLRLSSFEGCIAGTRHLIDLCVRSAECGKHPATFNFCSSVSTAEETRDATIKEALPPDFSYARNTGYAQSKLVCEHICHRVSEATGLTCRVLRVGQLVGDTKHGIWNSHEAFPLMWQSARTIGALPKIQETPRWLPVDVAAQTISDISISEQAPTGVYNVTNPRTFHWTRDLLPMLHASGLGKFEEIDPVEWVRRLRNSDSNPVTNPPYKLVEFFEWRYGKEGGARVPAQWETEASQKFSSALKEVSLIDQALVNKIVDYLADKCWTAKGA